MINVSKKQLFLVFPCLRPLLLQTRTKLGKSLKFYKLQIVFKSQNKLANTFRFKDCIPKELTSGVAYKFYYGFRNKFWYGEFVRHLNVRVGQHIEISPLNKKKVKPKGSAVSNHLLLCKYLLSFKSFVVLTKDNRKLV